MLDPLTKLTPPTKGPWQIGRKLTHTWVITGYGIDICSTKINRYTDNSIREANARLIAAAPDMLAALQLYDATYASTQTHPTVVQEAACIATIRAAIAKAIGQE